MLVLTISFVATITIASGEPLSSDTNKPRYSETCEHGHNGFDCKEPAYRIDIKDLQKRVSELEKYH